jgi:hypothetical protein
MSKQPAGERTKADRRAWVRYPCNLETLYQPGKGLLEHRWWFAKVCDISQSGIGIILRRQFEPGTQLSIALHSKSADFSRTIEATVVHVMPHPDGCLVGATFSSMLSEKELRAYWSDQRLAQAVEEAGPPGPEQED